ncbi:unnamed protein product [Arctia plantaginis]|uniref:Uncharacterized protein n=1 Tax=Arctia plantaginis TaxID=874455 RepID=A0A8S1AE19_ARCPL|nr:unnamed protein product [Arctia plantaginis]
MFKILLITAVVATVYARPQEGHGHSHGHAYSSQNIVLHQAHETKHEPHHEHHLQKHEEHHNYEEHKDNEHHGHHEHHVDYYAHPKYEFAYEVKDPHTHDFKHQHEHRDGDVVVGEYALHQPDGTIRIVKYHADKKTGFNADVKYEGHAKHIVLLVTAVIATVYARPQDGHDHNHGHAYSSQNIVLHQPHDTKHEPHHEHHHQGHEEQHKHEEHKENEHHGHHEHHVDYYVC